MRKYLTQKVCEKAKPKDKPYQIHDTAITGFILRIEPLKPHHPPGGLKTFSLIQNGKPERFGTMPIWTCGIARGKAERILRGEDDDNDAPAHPEPEQLTFEEYLTDRYQDYVNVHHSRPKETMNCLRRFKLGDKLLEDIKLADGESFQLQRQKKGINHHTINRNTALLHKALEKAVDWEFLEENPLARLKPLKTDKRKVVRYLKTAEEKRLTAALIARDDRKRRERKSANEWRRERDYDLLPTIGIYCDNLTPLSLLAINTGLRRGELWNLTWRDVDLKRKMLTVHGKGAKSGQTRHIPLNSAAMTVLKNHRGSVAPMPTIPVFGRAEFRKAWAGVLKNAKIEKFRFHDLRHTFASKLVMVDVPLNTVRELMGHASLDMTLVYAHLAPDNLRAAVDLI